MIKPEEGRALAATAVKVTPVDSTTFQFTLPDGRILQFSVDGHVDGCVTCGYGSEILTSWEFIQG